VRREADPRGHHPRGRIRASARPDKPKALRTFGGTTLLERRSRSCRRVERIFVAVPHSFPLVPDKQRYERDRRPLERAKVRWPASVPALERAAPRAPTSRG
jgi:hypothetical protein